MTDQGQTLGEPRLVREALGDLAEGLRRWPVWVHLGLNDIRLRYRRSVIGQNWQTLNIGILVVAISFVYASLLKVSFTEQLVYLASAYVIWLLMQALVTEGCQAFMSSDQMLLNYRLPLSVCAYQLVLRNLAVFGHSLLLLVPIFFITGHGYPVQALLLVPALALYALNGLWVALVLGILSARFRDIPQFVSSFMQIAFLVTPVLYSPTSISAQHRGFVDMNPFAHFLAIGRDPLLGKWPPSTSYVVVVCITGVGLACALAVFARTRRRLTFWL
jgi:ABC-type polysaccharide/polyol phosphate export permease